MTQVLRRRCPKTLKDTQVQSLCRAGYSRGASTFLLDPPPNHLNLLSIREDSSRRRLSRVAFPALATLRALHLSLQVTLRASVAETLDPKVVTAGDVLEGEVGAHHWFRDPTNPANILRNTLLLVQLSLSDPVIVV